MIDLDFLQRLIDALDASGLDSLELERGGTRIKLARTPPHPVVGENPGPASVAAQPASPAPQGPPSATAPVPEPPAQAVAAASDLIDVESPMVGTFYRAPAPDAPPYVDVGTRVGKGDALCIIEAMKLMNELECEVAGTIAEICVENAQPVEYGQVLFRIEPS